jgi:pimeloyl-ACP methyl ester carboxylesterase
MQIEIRGIPVYYRDEGAGRPIVMIPGRPGFHMGLVLRMEPIFADRPGWRRIYLDLPGMGNTPGADWITSQQDVLDLLCAFIDAVIPGQRFATVGMSYGGYMALGLVRQRRADLDGVMLWTPAMRLDRDPEQLPAHQVFEADPEVVASVGPDEQTWLRVASVQTAETLAAFRTAIKPGFAMADMPFLERVAERDAFDFDPAEIAEPLAVPTLLLAGRQDSVVGYSEMLGVAEAFPRATIAVLDRAGHALASEQSALFEALVGEWLDRVAEAAG